MLNTVNVIQASPSDFCSVRQSYSSSSHILSFTDFNISDGFFRTKLLNMTDDNAAGGREARLRYKLNIASRLLYKLIKDTRHLEADRQRLLLENQQLKGTTGHIQLSMLLMNTILIQEK